MGRAVIKISCPVAVPRSWHYLLSKKPGGKFLAPKIIIHKQRRPITMKILFIINPKAGGTNHEKTILSLKNLLKAEGLDGQFYLTTGREDEKRITNKIEKFKP